MNKKFCFFTLIILIYFCSTGCAIRHGDFAVLSNKLIRVSEFELDKTDRTKNVVGEEVVHIISFIPTGGRPTLENAIDDALDKGNGDVLIDGVMYSKNWWFIFGQLILEVKGTVVKTRNNLD